jgi:predicted ferric reductase
MLGLQFALVARIRRISRPFGIDVVLQFHRQITFVALAFVLLHPLLLFIEDTKFLDLLDVTTAPLRARMAVLAVVALLVLVALSVWRRRINLSYERWQLTHGLLAIVVVAAALTHVLLVGYYVDEPWEKALWGLLSFAFISLLLWVRVLKPLRRAREPWRIEEVHPERGGATSVVLRPHDKAVRDAFGFEPGQFAWLMIDQSPFAITQHPFSLSSSCAGKGDVVFTIKSLGDFTTDVQQLQPGTTVYLDGPYGSFSPFRYSAPGHVLLGAGVGITPLMSILRTSVDRGDPLPGQLFYGSRDWENITFRDELDAIGQREDFEVIHVLEEPPEDWTGERGYIDEAILRRHLPDDYLTLHYFVCGPAAMMDAAERALLAIGVPDEQIHIERFMMA